MKTNNSISETPVTISAFIIGMFVIVKTAFLENFFLSAVMPTAAAVPKTVEITAESTATIRVCSRAVSIERLKIKLA